MGGGEKRSPPDVVGVVAVGVSAFCYGLPACADC